MWGKIKFKSLKNAMPLKCKDNFFYYYQINCHKSQINSDCNFTII